MLSIYRLPNQLPDEKIVRVVRRHGIILVKKALFSFLLFLLPLPLGLMIADDLPVILASANGQALINLLLSAYYLFTWLFFFFSFIDYYLDIWIVTDERIIDVQQIGFFSRVIAEQRLYRIQDVTSEIHGLLPTFFRYGQVFIQTAGTVQRFNFFQVPDPEGLRDLVIKLSEQSKEKHHQEIGEEGARDLEQRFSGREKM